MVQFEKTLEGKKVSVWEPYYINYGSLKKTIKKLQDRVSPESQNFVTYPPRKENLTLNEAQEYFSKRLDDEVEKVVLFFLKQQGILASEILALNMEAEETRDLAPRKRASSAALNALEPGQVYDRKSFGNLRSLLASAEKQHKKSTGSEELFYGVFNSPRSTFKEDHTRRSSTGSDEGGITERRSFSNLPLLSYTSIPESTEQSQVGNTRNNSEDLFSSPDDNLMDVEMGPVKMSPGELVIPSSPLANSSLSPLGGSRKNLSQLIVSTQNINYLHDNYMHIAKSLMLLVDFLDLNVTGLRKIIKKFEKSLHHAMGRDYFITRQERSLSQLKVLYRNEGLKALIGSLKRALEELASARQKLKSGSPATLERTVSEIEPIYKKLIVRQKRMEQEQRKTFQQFIIQRTDMFLELAQHAEEEEMEEEEEQDIEEHMPSYYINLICTFLYMVNFTINSPTCPNYAILLGGDLTMNGLVNGMTPLAACISCPAFSLWTNKCFRPPLYVAITFLCIGNMLYALALYFNAFWMLCLGRLIVGLGGPRGMNRRYIADTVPVSRRTAASAAFVASTAAGTAIGPGFAGLWGDRSFTVFGHRITPETAPGWAMVLGWLFYLLLLIFYSKEPTFRHLPKGPVGDDSDDDEAQMDFPIQARVTDEVKYVVTHAYGTYEKNQTISQKSSNEKEVLVKKVKQNICLPKIPFTVWTLLFYYFVQKYITELIVQSMPVISRTAFDWTVEKVGGVLTCLAVLVLPVNMLTGKLSPYIEDRPMLVFLSTTAAVCTLIVLDLESFGLPYSEYQYVFGCFAAYVVLCAYEGVLMSLLSRIISPELAKGTCNSGLLATEFGTFGRVVADFSISFVGLIGSVDMFVNCVFLPCSVLVSLVVTMTLCMYKQYRA